MIPNPSTPATYTRTPDGMMKSMETVQVNKGDFTGNILLCIYFAHLHESAMIFMYKIIDSCII